MATPSGTLQLRERRGNHADFRVRKKVFAYFLNNHHGDGIVSVCVKPELGENEDGARHHPDRYHLPAYFGKRGWFERYWNRGLINWEEVDNVIQLSARLTAPEALVALLPWSSYNGHGNAARRNDA